MCKVEQTSFYVICFDFLKQLASSPLSQSTLLPPALGVRMSSSYCVNEEMFESTSFIETQSKSQTYKGDQISMEIGELE